MARKKTPESTKAETTEPTPDEAASLPRPTGMKAPTTDISNHSSLLDAHIRHCRKGAATALRSLRKHYRAVAAPDARWLVYSAAAILVRAVRDCESLDRELIARNLPPFYLSESELDSHEALTAIHCMVLKEQREAFAHKGPVWKALKEEGPSAALSKRILHQIRESIRDGYSASQALDIHSLSIASRANEGDTQFFEALGNMLRDFRGNPAKYRRNFTDWLARAWLPLCLWECAPDGLEAEERFAIATALIGFTMPAFPQFLTAWRNIRSHTMKGAVKARGRPPSETAIRSSDQ